MERSALITHFEVVGNEAEENYVYRIPDCQMFRLHKGDELSLRQYKPLYPFSDLERWIVEVVSEPVLEVNWSRGDPGNTAFDEGSVRPRQVVHVRVKSHKYM